MTFKEISVSLPTVVSVSNCCHSHNFYTCYKRDAALSLCVQSVFFVPYRFNRQLPTTVNHKDYLFLERAAH